MEMHGTQISRKSQISNWKFEIEGKRNGMRGKADRLESLSYEGGARNRDERRRKATSKKTKAGQPRGTAQDYLEENSPTSLVKAGEECKDFNSGSLTASLAG